MTVRTAPSTVLVKTLLTRLIAVRTFFRFTLFLARFMSALGPGETVVVGGKRSGERSLLAGLARAEQETN